MRRNLSGSSPAGCYFFGPRPGGSPGRLKKSARILGRFVICRQDGSRPQHGHKEKVFIQRPDKRSPVRNPNNKKNTQNQVLKVFASLLLVGVTAYNKPVQESVKKIPETVNTLGRRGAFPFPYVNSNVSMHTTVAVLSCHTIGNQNKKWLEWAPYL